MKKAEKKPIGKRDIWQILAELTDSQAERKNKGRRQPRARFRHAW